MEVAAALCVILLFVLLFIGYHQVRCDGRETREELKSIRGEVTTMGRKVAAVTQSHNGARVMAESAIIRAQHAEAVAGAAKKAAATPIVLVCKSANDADMKTDEIKTQ